MLTKLDAWNVYIPTILLSHPNMIIQQGKIFSHYKIVVDFSNVLINLNMV